MRSRQPIMIGKTISHYRILSEIGAGGMGVVYKAEDTQLKRPVALKFLPSSLTRDREAKARFIREARAASKLEHPNICTIHEISETEDGQIFLVMACYEGETLKEKLARTDRNIPDKYLDTEVAIRAAIQVSEGLARAHEEGIVHRDIKPANIMMTRRGEIKILDFGLAKLAGQSHLTKDFSMPGTVAFMSPEQLSGREVDQRTDIWSLGVVLYEMLTGRQPFSAEYDQAVIYSILNEEPQSIMKYNKDISPELASIVSKCLEKDMKKRYQSMPELKAALKSLLRETDVPASDLLLRKREIISYRDIFRFAAIFMGMVIILLFLYESRFFVNVLRIQGESKGKYLAVLPLQNVGNDTINAAFCEGLMEYLTSQLTRLEKYRDTFWVLPASEVRKREIKSPSEALQALGATLAITGSWQDAEQQVRMTLNLVDTRTLRQLNSLAVTDSLSSILTFQDNLVTEVADMLGVELDPKVREALVVGGTTRPGAYDYYIQGCGYLQRYEKIENIDMAINLFRKALNQDRQYALAHAGLGEAYWRKFDASKDIQWVQPAMSHCDSALSVSDQLAPVHITMGLIHAGTGHYQEAISDFQMALEIDPVNAAAYREMAGTFETMGNIVQVEKTYEKAIRFRPTDWSVYNNLGVFYYHQGRYDEAIRQLRQVVLLTPDNIRGYNNLGVLLFTLDRWKEAKKMFGKSLEISMNNYVACANLGTIYFYEAQYKEAARMYERALQLSANDYRVWGNLAESYYWIPESKSKSADCYRHAIQLAKHQLSVNPQDPEILSDLAGYHGTIGEREKALYYLSKVEALDPRNLDVLFTIASAYERLGERQIALHWIEKAFEQGYVDVKIDNYPGLADLRRDAHYRQLLEKYKGRQ